VSKDLYNDFVPYEKFSTFILEHHKGVDKRFFEEEHIFFEKLTIFNIILPLKVVSNKRVSASSYCGVEIVHHVTVCYFLAGNSNEPDCISRR